MRAAGQSAERYLIRCLTGAVFKTCDFSSIHVPGAIELPGGSFSLGAGSVVAIRNRLLAALPPTDLGMLTPHFQKVMFGPNAVLVRSGTELDEGRRTGRISSSPLPPSLRRGASHSRLTPNARSASTTCGRKLAPGDAGSERPVAHLSNRRRTQVGETSPGRVLPVVFDVRHKSKHDVDRTVPDDLAIDMSSCPI